MNGNETTTRATLHDVARQAGVSIKTASRALGGEAYVSAQTRERVMTAAKALGYQRNAQASLLARGRVVDTVALITGDLTNPFYSAVAQGVEDALRARNIYLTVANSGEDASREWELAQAMADRQVKAVLVASALDDHSQYAQLEAIGIPVVFLDRPARNLDADAVVFDNRGGGRLAAQHLLDTGHTEIAYIGDYDWLSTAQDRLQGIDDVLADASPHWRTRVRMGAHDAQTAAQFTAELLGSDNVPTTIIAGNNRVLFGVASHLRDNDINDVALLGFDDVEWAPLLDITTVSGDPIELGRRLAERAMIRMGGSSEPTSTAVLPMRLEARESTTARALNTV